MKRFGAHGTDFNLPADAPWYQRMLGPSSLSWQVVVFAGILNFPQMVLTGGNLGARTVQPGEYPTIAVISLATILISFLYGYVGHKTVFRSRHVRPVPLATFLTFYALGGLLYSLGIQVSDAVSGSPSDIPFALRAIDAMLLSIAWAIGVSLVLDGRSRFRSERSTLVEELVAEQERLQQQNALVTARQGQLANDVAASLSRHLEQISNAAEEFRQSNHDSRSAKLLSAAIDTAADVGVRQSSHAVWQEALTSAATPRIQQTIRAALTSPQIWPGPMAVLVAIGVPTVAVRNFGLWWGLPATAALGVLVWLWMRAVQRIRWTPWACFGLSFVGTVVAVAAFAVLPAPESPELVAEVGAIVVGLAGGFALVSFVAALQRERGQALRALREEILAEEAARLAEARAVAALARQLHGPVQTTLRVCAAEIERAAHEGDGDAIDTAVDEALRALVDFTSEPASSETTMTESLATITATWDGFMDVTMDVDPQLGHQRTREDVVEVVNEALSNAHHHGRATAAHVSVQRELSGLGIHVQDNGSTSEVGPAGLGTRLLRTLATEYHLSTSQTGARLDVVLPLPGDHQTQSTTQEQS